MVRLTPEQVLAFRIRAQQLDREGGALADTALLDLGAQDTGPDGGRWALRLRGVDIGPDGDVGPDDAGGLASVWTVRGAPHLYRREDLSGVAAATAPFSEADAGKRIYDAARPLRRAGIGTVEALDTVAAAMRRIVVRPTVKGEVSSRLAAELPPPYLRDCRVCRATHIYEMPFRLAALRAGLDLQPGTSPPILRRIPRFRPAPTVPPRLDVIRAYLRLLGPATPAQVAAYLDAPVADVRARWPEDAVEVDVSGEKRSVLAGDEDALSAPVPDVTRLLGPFDLFLQARDRPLLVPDQKRAAALWPTLGRPGAILHRGGIAGVWRPRKSGRRFTVAVELWPPPTAAIRTAIEAQAEQLAAFRGITLAAVDHT
jgi:hypothetical protein